MKLTCSGPAHRSRPILSFFAHRGCRSCLQRRAGTPRRPGSVPLRTGHIPLRFAIFSLRSRTLDCGLFRQTLIRTNDRSLRNWVRRHRCRVIGASSDGSADLHRFDFPRPDDPRPRRGASGAHAAAARPLLRLRPHPDGRRRRLAESRRGGKPAPLRGVSGQVGQT